MHTIHVCLNGFYVPIIFVLWTVKHKNRIPICFVENKRIVFKISWKTVAIEI